jgi:hypothetical protein
MELSFDKNSSLSYIISDKPVKTEQNNNEQQNEGDSSDLLISVVNVT